MVETSQSLFPSLEIVPLIERATPCQQILELNAVRSCPARASPNRRKRVQLVFRGSSAGLM